MKTIGWNVKPAVHYAPGKTTVFANFAVLTDGEPGKAAGSYVAFGKDGAEISQAEWVQMWSSLVEGCVEMACAMADGRELTQSEKSSTTCELA